MALSLIGMAASADPVPPEFAAAVAAAEQAGKELDAAARNPPPVSEEAVAAARGRIKDFCDSDYTAVPLDATGRTIYFIRGSSKPSEIVIGRHYRVSADAVTPSSVACSTLQAPPAGAVAVYVTHLLSETPTEFHVFLSLQQANPIFVGARGAVWSVEHGVIRYVQRPAAAAPPTDASHPVTASEAANIDEAVRPIIAQARQTYRGAKSRFLAGFPPGFQFFVVTRLSDASGRFEQVFVRVDRYAGTSVLGRISNDLDLLKGYHKGDKVTVPDDKVIDWVIVDPDGVEEGNLVGKYLDEHGPRQ